MTSFARFSSGEETKTKGKEMEADDLTYKQKAGMYREMVDKLGNVLAELDSLGNMCEVLKNDALSEIESGMLMLARAISDIIRAARICEGLKTVARSRKQPILKKRNGGKDGREN